VDKDPDWRVKLAAQAEMPNPELAPVARQKAFALRAIFNDVRAGLNPTPGTKNLEKPRPEDKPKPKPEDKPKADGGTVKGVVTFDGKPLAKGTLTLTDKDGKALSGAIAADGSYALENVPPGDYKVSVADPAVPAKYAKPETSGLTLTVTKSKHQFDLQLTKGSPGAARGAAPAAPRALSVGRAGRYSHSEARRPSSPGFRRPDDAQHLATPPRRGGPARPAGPGRPRRRA